MKKICIFIHYANVPHFPYYVMAYVQELANFFDEILIVSNERELTNASQLLTKRIRLLQVPNEGYDLGMFLKAFATLDCGEYEQIGCVNDSNILLRRLDFLFDWAKENPVDLWGLMDADIRPDYSTHQHNFHLQSHFLIFNRSAFATLQTFIKQLNFYEFTQIAKVKDLKKRVINDWEIGLSQFFIQEGLTVKGFFHANDYFWDGTKALSHVKMLQAGVPVIKKKVITSITPRNLSQGKNYWSKLVKKYANEPVDTQLLLSELRQLRRQYLMRAAKHLFKE